MKEKMEKEQLPFQISEADWGEVRAVDEVCPGVYYLATSDGDHPFCREFYAVLQEAVPRIISEEAFSYDQPAGLVRLFEYEVENSGWPVISFEVKRYRVIHGLPLDKYDSLYASAIYAAEHYTDYFGGMLPPRNTPYGLTTRVKKVAEGVFFLDTLQCQWLLAVASPIWLTDFSDFVRGVGEFCKDDCEAGEEEAKYLFFRRDRCAPAIYELLVCSDYQGLTKYIHSKECLETQLYQRFPEYVIWNNGNELSGHGKGDILNDLLAMLGCPLEDDGEEDEEAAARRQENCIHFWPELAGQELLLLPE